MFMLRIVHHKNVAHHLLNHTIHLPSSSTSRLRRTIQIERRTNQRQMTKRLRCIPQLLTTPRNLLGEHTQMICKAQHILKDVDCPYQILLLIHTRSGKCFDQPESTHGESTFTTADTVVGVEGVVTVDETGGCETSFLRWDEDSIHGVAEAWVVGGDEEDEWRDEDG